MTETVFTDNVKVDGSRDIAQLAVQGHTTQEEPLQTWENSAGDPLAQITGDGRFQIGDFETGGMATEDAIIEAYRDENAVLTPKRGFHLFGAVKGTLSDVVSWVVHELELKGSGGISALHTALRVKLTNQNTGTMTSAQLRAGDFEAINTGGSSGTPVTEVVAVRAAVTNHDEAHVIDAIGLEVVMSEEEGGATTNAYGIRVDDVNQGSGGNYAIYTGEGMAHFGDALEIPVMATPPGGNPPTDFIKVYSKLDGGDPKLFGKDASGIEHSLSAGGGNYVELLANTMLGSSAASISLSSIPATYDHLELILQLCSDRSGQNNDGLIITFNSDTGSGNYSWSAAQMTSGTTVIVAANNTDTGIKPPIQIPGGSSPTDYFGLTRLLITNYANTAHYRHCYSTGYVMQSVSGYRHNRFNGIWKNTANAISSIQIAPLAGSNFIAGSSYSLYGVGG